jgi:hypothetical protein
VEVRRDLELPLRALNFERDRLCHAGRRRVGQCTARLRRSCPRPCRAGEVDVDAESIDTSLITSLVESPKRFGSGRGRGFPSLSSGGLGKLCDSSIFSALYRSSWSTSTLNRGSCEPSERTAFAATPSAANRSTIWFASTSVCSCATGDRAQPWATIRDRRSTSRGNASPSENSLLRRVPFDDLLTRGSTLDAPDYHDSPGHRAAQSLESYTARISISFGFLLWIDLGA